MASRAVTARDRRTMSGVALLALLVAGALFLLQHSWSSGSLGEPGQAITSSPAPPPSSPWTKTQVQDLLAVVRAAGAEGLMPEDYKVDELQSAVDRGQTGAALDEAADAAAGALAHDYAAGRIRNRHRFNWYIDYAGPNVVQLAGMLRRARDKGDLKAWFAGLLPRSPDYRALREALATTPDIDELRRDRIKANLERWRWLPRDFGKGDQLYINLPTYQVQLMRGAQTIAVYKAVIGATDMPTPVLSSAVRQVIANPDWIVPMSIVRKSHLRPSSRYVFSTKADGTLRVRQKPGPGNALGRVKIEFPNKLAIYFHDTPSRSLFGADARTFSHGCVRVQNIDELAAAIVDRPERLANALSSTNTRSFPLATPLQSNIVYLTLVPGAEGGLTDVGDPYKLDEALAAALTGRKVVKATATPPVVRADPTPRNSSRPAPSTSRKTRERATAAAPSPTPPADAVATPAAVPQTDAPVPIADPTPQVEPKEQ